MNKKNFQIVFPVVLLIADGFSVLGSGFLSYWLRFYSPLLKIFPVTKGIPPLSWYWVLFGLVVVVWLVIFYLNGLYKSSRPKNGFDVFWICFSSISVGSVLILAFGFFYRSTSFSRLVLVLLWITSIIFITLTRLALGQIEKVFFKRGIGVRRTLLVGTGPVAQNIFNKLKTNPLLGYLVIGMVDPDEEKIELEQTLPVLGKLSGLPHLIQSHKIDLVLMALPFSYHQKMLETILACDFLEVEFQIAPDLLELLTVRAKITNLEGIPFIQIGHTPLEGWNHLVKRGFDLVFSLLGLVILFPVFLLLSLLIRIDSRGPIFYTQERLGLDGKKFRMLKFRSMYKEAEMEGAGWTREQDQRRTRIGKSLRKMSLDELPQLINVLKGEMSLVGPRPEREVYVEQFRETVPRYFIRHKVKSGMTGWAQVNGLRGDTSISERTKFDLFYLENWSLGLDVKIIWLTFKNLFRQKNAY